MAQRLDRMDWIKAGFRALVSGGPEALRVEPIARGLKATKGSFYWHFSGLEDLRLAMVAYWRQAATDKVIIEMETLPPGMARMEALMRLASSTPEDVGGTQAEPAFRRWAGSYAPAAQALQAADAARVAYLEKTLADMTADAPQAARVIYAAHLGQQVQGHDGEKAARDLIWLVAQLGDSP